MKSDNRSLYFLNVDIRFNESEWKYDWQDRCVINDPLGQTHSLASSEHCFRFKFVLFWKVGMDRRTDERTTCAKTMIPTGRDCGLAEWIKIMYYFNEFLPDLSWIPIGCVETWSHIFLFSILQTSLKGGGESCINSNPEPDSQSTEIFWLQPWRTTMIKLKGL